MVSFPKRFDKEKFDRWKMRCVMLAVRHWREETGGNCYIVDGCGSPPSDEGAVVENLIPLVRVRT